MCESVCERVYVREKERDSVFERDSYMASNIR